MIQNKAKGFSINPNSSPEEARLAAVAFADDLLPIATTREDLQLQLDITYSFLSYHGMRMNVTKTHILTNLRETNPEFPLGQNKLTLGGKHIESVKPRTETSRILGFFCSMDGSAKRTLDHAMITYESQLNRMNFKMVPSKATTNIINSVILSKLAYRLQVTALPNYRIDKINVAARKLIKRKANLPRSTPTNLIHDKSFGIGIKSFEEIHAAQLIANTISMQRSRGTVGAFLQEVSLFYKNHLKVPLDIYEAPMEFTLGEQNSLARMTSHTLFQRRLQIRGLRHYDPTKCPSQLLSIEAYNEHHEILGKMQLKASDFLRPTAPVNARRSLRNQDITAKTKDFNSFIISKTQHVQELCLGYGFWAPSWFSMIVCGLTDTKNRDIRTGESLVIPASQDNIHVGYTFTGARVLSLYTDGSMKGMGMGSACLFVEEGEQNVEFQFRPSQTNPSADKAELTAILEGLLKCSSSIKLSIFTDSQNSIKFIDTLKGKPSERNILKINNYPIVERINHELQRFDTRPKLYWVKGHQDDPNNNTVDSLAQSARLDLNIEPKDINIYKTGLALKRDLHLYHQANEDELHSVYRTDTYPRSFFKNQFSLSLRQSNITRLNRKWGEECPELNDDDERDNSARKAAIELDLAPDYDLTTTALNSVLGRVNHFDSSNQQVHSFRLNLINRDTLYTLDLLIEQCKYWVRKGNTCVHCKEELETYEHIWECKFLQDHFDQFKERTHELLQEQMKTRCSKNKTPLTDTLQDMIASSTDKFFFFDQGQRENELRRFLSSPEAKGIITPQSFRNFNERINLEDGAPGGWLYTTIVASWTRALYELWWKPRTKLIQKEQRQEIKAIEKKRKLDKKKKREEKQKMNKRKRDQAILKLAESRAKRKKEKENKKKDNTQEAPRTKKQKLEIRNMVRESNNAKEREKKSKWDLAMQKLKKDRAAKKPTKRQDAQPLPNGSPQTMNRKRKRKHENNYPKKKNPLAKDNETEHPSATHITKKPPDKRNRLIAP
jgi:ribonuclease HI